MVNGWHFSIGRVYGVFTRFTGGSLDLGEHNLLIVTYPGIIGEFFELLEELVTVFEVDLPELFLLCAFDLFIGVLPHHRNAARFRNEYIPTPPVVTLDKL